MNILVSGSTGSTGSTGSSLVPYLVSSGHDVTRLVRRELGSEEPRSTGTRRREPLSPLP